jgi:hypothetical protein
VSIQLTKKLSFYTMTTAKEMNPELVRACTPVFLATIGGVIGLAAVLCPLSDGQRSSGMGLAGTAIAGAAGLAQNTKNESNINGQNATVKVDAVPQPASK